MPIFSLADILGQQLDLVYLWIPFNRNRGPGTKQESLNTHSVAEFIEHLLHTGNFLSCVWFLIVTAT